ncbi:Prefoldin subunit 6 [Nowakowskiella sp. JEL0407]|nr:Prefoldin subunit 6 [Nowakowskiella sp. JEL0407]
MSGAEVIGQKLEAAVVEYQNLEKEYSKVVNNRAQLQSQLQENELVQKELELLSSDSIVYKLTGPVLVKQDHAEAKANVKKRIEYISSDFKRTETRIKELEDKQDKKRTEVIKLQNAYQDIMQSICLIFLLIAACKATTISGQIVPNWLLFANLLIPNIPKDLAKLTPATKAVLNNGQFTAYIKEDGSFNFFNVPEGSHTLRVVSPEFVFDHVRVDVSSSKVSASITQLGAGYAREGPKLSHPIELTPKRPLVYFHEREKFNVMSLFSNPMILLSVFSLGAVFLLPKLTANMDPEMLEEMKQTQKSMGLGNNGQVEMPDFQKSMMDWLAPPPPQVPETEKKSGSKKKRN